MCTQMLSKCLLPIAFVSMVQYNIIMYLSINASLKPVCMPPYSVHKLTHFYFLCLDTYIQKSRKNFMDSRNRRNLSRINDELQDVQRIMMQNIDDILQRGEQLSGIFHEF